MKRAFTVLEVLVTLFLLGIILGISSYFYKDFILRAKRLEAVHNLGVIRELEEVYREEHGKYVTCYWSPVRIPPPQGTDDWNESSYFYLLGFRPQGLVRYRYSVAKANGSRNISQCVSNVSLCYSDGLVRNGFTQSRDGVIDIIMKAEADLDGDGIIGKVFIPDEPPQRVIYVDYSVY